MLEVANLVVHYDGAVAVDDVTMRIENSELVSLIGPNGAGKSSLIKAVAGLVPIDGGKVSLDGRLAYVPEGRQLFRDLTVDQNLRLGAWPNRRQSTDYVYDLLPEIKKFEKRKAGQLSGGEQQLVAVARGLMAKPDLLAIDELSLGLSPLATAKLVSNLISLHESLGIAMLIVEQSATVALKMCQRAYVMEAGRIVKSGTSSELIESGEMLDAYLGGMGDGQP